jgi:hypothetical protein
MIDAKPVNTVNSNDFEGTEIAIKGLLLGKGNFVTGGEAWIVADWENREKAESRVRLVPENAFITLLENLDAFGGGEYVLHYQVAAKGKFVNDSRDFQPSEILVETEDEQVKITFN